jgi:hypothetical protein
MDWINSFEFVFIRGEIFNPRASAQIRGKPLRCGTLAYSTVTLRLRHQRADSEEHQ